MPPSTTIWSPALRPDGNVVLVAARDSPASRAAAQSCRRLRRHRRTADSRRRAESPRPAPAGRCFPRCDVDPHAHVHLLLQQAVRVVGDHPHRRPSACPDRPRAAMLSTVAGQALRARRRCRLRPGRRARPKQGPIRKCCAMHPDPRKVGHGEARRGAGLQQLSRRDQLLHHGSGDRRADHALDACGSAGPPECP